MIAAYLIIAGLLYVAMWTTTTAKLKLLSQALLWPVYAALITFVFAAWVGWSLLCLLVYIIAGVVLMFVGGVASVAFLLYERLK